MSVKAIAKAVSALATTSNQSSSKFTQKNQKRGTLPSSYPPCRQMKRASSSLDSS